MQLPRIACFYIHVRLKKVSYLKVGVRNVSINFRLSKNRHYQAEKRFKLSFDADYQEIV